MRRGTAQPPAQTGHESALAAVPPQDTPNDWQGGPLQAPPDVAALARDLTAAGLDAGRAGVLRDGADRAVIQVVFVPGRSGARPGTKVRITQAGWVIPWHDLATLSLAGQDTAIAHGRAWPGEGAHTGIREVRDGGSGQG
jgi:hypothetical protein